MQKQYIIKRINDNKVCFNTLWGSLTKICIDDYPWNENNYMPVVEAAAGWDDSGLYLFFKSYENKITVRHLESNSAVCKDSCVEFFFNPNPKDSDNYLNFETNAAGTLLLAIGKDRYNRTFIDPADFDIFKVSASQIADAMEKGSESFWTISYFIPFEFIERYYGKIDAAPGYMFKGNFYKCGDETDYAHYGCWNEVVNPCPDFHRPECFGDLVLE